jgi:hypothetical protein
MGSMKTEKEKAVKQDFGDSTYMGKLTQRGVFRAAQNVADGAE